MFCDGLKPNHPLDKLVCECLNSLLGHKIKTIIVIFYRWKRELKHHQAWFIFPRSTTFTTHPAWQKKPAVFVKYIAIKWTFPFNSHFAFWIVSGYEVCKNKLESMHKGLKDWPMFGYTCSIITLITWFKKSDHVFTPRLI